MTIYVYKGPMSPYIQIMANANNVKDLNRGDRFYFLNGDSERSELLEATFVGTPRKVTRQSGGIFWTVTIAAKGFHGTEEYRCNSLDRVEVVS